MKKYKIAIVAGGDSSEHDVSLKSAAGILSWIDTNKFDAEIVELKGADIETLNKLVTFDFAYITIHGTPGENGLLQGFLEMMHIPFSCCGVLPAALTFNKYACNHYLQDFGMRIANSVLLRKITTTSQFAHSNGPDAYALDDASKFYIVGENTESSSVVEREYTERIPVPSFIKSNVGGSSFGCSKVKTKEQILPAVQRAFQEGNEVICESLLEGIEITCGVYKTKSKAVAFPITEVVSKNEFFDYDAKYNGSVDEITPARIPDEVRDRVQALTLKIYDILGCKGIIRTDYIVTPHTDRDWDINLLEVNTTPGMTPTSFIPQQVRAAGLNITDVLTEIIEDQLTK